MTTDYPLPAPRTRRLPMIVAPFRDETLESYLGRLAAANFLTLTELRQLLAPNLPARTKRIRMDLRVLADSTGRSATALCWALPELRPQLPGFAALAGPLPLEVTQLTASARQACRLCVSARGLQGPVRIWTHLDRCVCLRHRLWIGEPAPYSSQISVNNQPEVLRAQTRADALVRRWGREATAKALRISADTLVGLDIRRGYVPTFQARNLRLTKYYGHLRDVSRAEPAYHAAIFPEVVTLAALLIDQFQTDSPPRWNQADLTRVARGFFETRPADAPFLGLSPDERNRWVPLHPGRFPPGQPEHSPTDAARNYGENGARHLIRRLLQLAAAELHHPYSARHGKWPDAQLLLYRYQWPPTLQN